MTEDFMIADDKAVQEVDLEAGMDTEEAILLGAKTMAGIGLGFVVVVLGATGIGAVLEATIVPTVLAKVAGAIAGGGVGLSKGIQDHRKFRAKKKAKAASVESYLPGA